MSKHAISKQNLLICTHPKFVENYFFLIAAYHLMPISEAQWITCNNVQLS